MSHFKIKRLNSLGQAGAEQHVVSQVYDKFMVMMYSILHARISHDVTRLVVTSYAEHEAESMFKWTRRLAGNILLAMTHIRGSVFGAYPDACACEGWASASVNFSGFVRCSVAG